VGSRDSASVRPSSATDADDAAHAEAIDAPTVVVSRPNATRIVDVGIAKADRLHHDQRRGRRDKRTPLRSMSAPRSRAAAG
jgi:hypothetical protein